jgi:hypothetical protein
MEPTPALQPVAGVSGVSTTSTEQF